MKKLSGNEAYAYVGRDGTSDTTNQTTEQDSDDEKDTMDPLSRRFLRIEDYIRTQLYHSLWNVNIGNAPVVGGVADAGTGRTAVLAEQLMNAYEQSVVQWTFRAIDRTDVTNAEGDAPEGELLTMLTNELTKRQIIDRTDTLNLSVPARLYDCRKDYAVRCEPYQTGYNVKYICTPIFPITLLFPSDTAIVDDDIGATYVKNWGNIPITFTLRSRSVSEGARQGLATLYQSLTERLENFLFSSNNEEDVMLQAIRQARQQIQDDARVDEEADIPGPGPVDAALQANRAAAAAQRAAAAAAQP